MSTYAIKFQPTFPSRRATKRKSQWSKWTLFQSSPLTRVATDILFCLVLFTPISIHATRVGGDDSTLRYSSSHIDFNPRHPRGWRLGISNIVTLISDFNPRHPRGWRLTFEMFGTAWKIFQSTPPAWVATKILFRGLDKAKFQSTPPAWVATIDRPTLDLALSISIHATRVGGDRVPESNKSMGIHFNPRHPRGWRLVEGKGNMERFTISIHATRVGGDSLCASLFTFCSNFNPRHPRGWRP